MAIERISSTELQVQRPRYGTEGLKKVRREANQSSHFVGDTAAGRMVELDGLLADAEGVRADIPGWEDARPQSMFIRGQGRVEMAALETKKKMAIEDAYGRVGEDYRPAWRERGLSMAKDIHKELDARGGESASQDDAEKAVASVVNAQLESEGNGAGFDASTGNPASDAVLNSMYGNEQYLRDFLSDMQGKIDAEAEMRSARVELQDMLSDWPDDGSKEPFSYTELIKGPDGEWQFVRHENVMLSKEDAQALDAKLELEIETAGGFTQMAHIELQMRVNKHKQTEEAMSNILKSMHDTHKSILGNWRV